MPKKQNFHKQTNTKGKDDLLLAVDLQIIGCVKSQTGAGKGRSHRNTLIFLSEKNVKIILHCLLGYRRIQMKVELLET